MLSKFGLQQACQVRDIIQNLPAYSVLIIVCATTSLIHALLLPSSKGGVYAAPSREVRAYDAGCKPAS